MSKPPATTTPIEGDTFLLSLGASRDGILTFCVPETCSCDHGCPLVCAALGASASSLRVGVARVSPLQPFLHLMREKGTCVVLAWVCGTLTWHAPRCFCWCACHSGAHQVVVPCVSLNLSPGLCPPSPEVLGGSWPPPSSPPRTCPGRSSNLVAVPALPEDRSTEIV